MKTILQLILALAALTLSACSFLAPKVPFVPSPEMNAAHANFCNSLTE